MLHLLPNEVVKVDGIGKFSLAGFLNNVQIAIRVARASVGHPATPAARWAMNWLRACGAQSKADVDRLETHLALLQAPPDPSRLVRCTRCTRPLSDPISKLIGVGPECRKLLQPRRNITWTGKRQPSQSRSTEIKGEAV